MSELLEAPLEDLLAEIGREVEPDLLLPRSFREAVAAGRSWLEANWEDLRAAICPRSRSIEAEPTPAQAVAALVDVLAAVRGVPAVASVSVVLYRFGVSSLCDGWRPK